MLPCILGERKETCTFLGSQQSITFNTRYYSRISALASHVRECIVEFLLLLTCVYSITNRVSGVVTPILIMAGSGPTTLNLTMEDQQYLLSAALITSALLSLIQITRFKIFGTGKH